MNAEMRQGPRDSSREEVSMKLCTWEEFYGAIKEWHDTQENSGLARLEDIVAFVIEKTYPKQKLPEAFQDTLTREIILGFDTEGVVADFDAKDEEGSVGKEHQEFWLGMWEEIDKAQRAALGLPPSDRIASDVS